MLINPFLAEVLKIGKTAAPLRLSKLIWIDVRLKTLLFRNKIHQRKGKNKKRHYHVIKLKHFAQHIL